MGFHCTKDILGRWYEVRSTTLIVEFILTDLVFIRELKCYSASRPVGLSFNQSVSRLVGRSVGQPWLGNYLQLTAVVHFFSLLLRSEIHLHSQMPKLLLTNFSQSSTVIGAHPGPSRDVEQFGCLLETLMTFCSWPHDSSEVSQRTLQSGSLEFEMVPL